jgi:hypothetical protein
MATETITMIAVTWEATRLRRVVRNAASPSTVAAVAASSPRTNAPAKAATSSRTKWASCVSGTSRPDRSLSANPATSASTALARP